MISGTLLALGPFIVPIILAGLLALTLLAAWLLESGFHHRSLLRIALGTPLALYLVAVAAAFITNA